MELLSSKRVDLVHDRLVDQGVDYEPLRLELLDHICCAIEQKMDCGVAFAEALEQSIHGFGPKGLERTQEATIYLITLKLRKMKKLAAISGLLGGFLTVFATVFKLLHWPGANIMLVNGIALIVLLFLPTMIYVQFKQTEGVWSKVTTVVGLITAIAMGIATLFKVLHWPGASVLIYGSSILLGMFFMPLYFVRTYRIAENKLFRSSIVIVIFAGIFLFIGLTQLGGGKIFSGGFLAIMERTYHMQETMSGNNAQYANQIDEKAQSSSEKIAEMRSKANELYLHLDDLQYQLIAATNGISVEAARNASPEKINWMAGPKEINQVLFAEEGNWTVKMLRQKMADYQAFALTQYPVANQELVSDNLSFTTLESWEAKQNQSWEAANFANRPLFFVVSYLDLVKTETRHIESQVLMYRLGQSTVAASTASLNEAPEIES